MFVIKQSRIWIFAMLVLLSFAVLAKEAAPLASDPELEQKVNAITSELRCLVCQNQTIADSHADLAIDLKNQVRDMVRNGKTRDDVVDYMVKRYGDFVRYRPPMKPTTYLLWVGPFLFMVGGVFLLVLNLRRRKQLVTDSPLSEEEHQKLDKILHSKNQSGTVAGGDK